MSSDSAFPPVRVGVSSCLLGQKVRFDTGHKHQPFLTQVLGPHVEFVPVCPEVEMGLPIPREAMRLEDHDGETRMMTNKTAKDVTPLMERFLERRLPELAESELDGYVLKKDSPSCGLFRVKLYRGASATREAAGLFAAALSEHLPRLALEEEGRLNDLPLRERFVTRIFASARWRQLLRDDPTAGGLVAFHSHHKMLLLAHDPNRYKALGPVVAAAGKGEIEDTLARYAEGFFDAMAEPTTPGRHVNVMQHLLSFLKEPMDSEEKQDLAALLGQYRQGDMPLAVPLKLIHHLLRKHDAPAWALEQVYLRPYPDDLRLRVGVA